MPFLFSCQIGTGDDERPILHGFYRSLDNGDSWEYRTGTVEEHLLTGIFPQVNIYEFVTDPFVPGIVYAFTNAGLWKTIDQGTIWKQVNNGIRLAGELRIINSLFFNPNNTNFMIATARGSVYITDNGGELWIRHDIELDPSVAIVGAFANPNNTNNIFAVASDGSIKESFDGGATWKRGRWFGDTHELLEDVTITKYRINPYNINEMYFITEGGNLFRSLDRGVTWSRKSRFEVRNDEDRRKEIITKINDIQFDYLNTPNTLYIATEQGVYTSINGGETWIELTATLPIRTPYVYTVGFDQTNPNRVCLATAKIKIYCTENKGVSWFPSTIPVNPDMAGALLHDRNDSSVMYLGVIRVD